MSWGRLAEAPLRVTGALTLPGLHAKASAPLTLGALEALERASTRSAVAAKR